LSGLDNKIIFCKFPTLHKNTCGFSALLEKVKFKKMAILCNDIIILSLNCSIKLEEATLVPCVQMSWGKTNTHKQKEQLYL
jgi:hypothetical protein